MKEKINHLENTLKIIMSRTKELVHGEETKAWPKGIKAKILIDLEEYEKALDVLSDAQKDVFKGYEDEIKNDDQAAIKLRVWNSGLMLAYATLFAKTNKPILAEVYASAVIQTPDPEGILKLRKKQAKKILAEIQK
jgi:hypothetical protein